MDTDSDDRYRVGVGRGGIGMTWPEAFVRVELMACWVVLGCFLFRNN